MRAEKARDFRFHSLEVVRESCGLTWAAPSSILHFNDLADLSEGAKSTACERVRHLNSNDLTPIIVATEEESQKDAPLPEVVFLSRQEIERLHSQTTLQRKVDGLLRNLIAMENGVGTGVSDPRFVYTHGTARDLNPEAGRFPGFRSTNAEVSLALDWLESKGFIKINGEKVQITLEGYQYGENWSNTVPTANQVFLVCAFSCVTDEIFRRRFSPIESDCGYTISRIKDQEFNGKVDDEILLQIRAASAVVVDLNESNYNVGFEAGYAYALGKPVIFTSQAPKLEVDKIPFDVRVHNIIWDEDDEAFIRRLANRIKLVGSSN
jgi:hypothetical protein